MATTYSFIDKKGSDLRHMLFDCLDYQPDGRQETGGAHSIDPAHVVLNHAQHREL